MKNTQKLRRKQGEKARELEIGRAEAAQLHDINYYLYFAVGLQSKVDETCGGKPPEPIIVEILIWGGAGIIVEPGVSKHMDFQLIKSSL